MVKLLQYVLYLNVRPIKRSLFWGVGGWCSKTVHRVNLSVLPLMEAIRQRSGPRAHRPAQHLLAARNTTAIVGLEAKE